MSNAPARFYSTKPPVTPEGSTAPVIGQLVVLPVITSPSKVTATVGKSFSYQIKASGNPTEYGVEGLPGKWTVNAKTGVISGTPKGPGMATMILKATNAKGTATSGLSLTVSK